MLAERAAHLPPVFSKRADTPPHRPPSASAPALPTETRPSPTPSPPHDRDRMYVIDGTKKKAKKPSPPHDRHSLSADSASPPSNFGVGAPEFSQQGAIGLGEGEDPSSAIFTHQYITLHVLDGFPNLLLLLILLFFLFFFFFSFCCMHLFGC